MFFDYVLGSSKFLKGKGEQKTRGRGVELDGDVAAVTGGGFDGGFLGVAEVVAVEVKLL